MIYKAENIDTDKILESINSDINYKITEQRIKTTEIIKYYEGYIQALEDVKDKFYCSNYEKDNIEIDPEYHKISIDRLE